MVHAIRDSPNYRKFQKATTQYATAFYALSELVQTIATDVSDFVLNEEEEEETGGKERSKGKAKEDAGRRRKRPRRTKARSSKCVILNRYRNDCGECCGALASRR